MGWGNMPLIHMCVGWDRVRTRVGWAIMGYLWVLGWAAANWAGLGWVGLGWAMSYGL